MVKDELTQNILDAEKSRGIFNFERNYPIIKPVEKLSRRSSGSK